MPTLRTVLRLLTVVSTAATAGVLATAPSHASAAGVASFDTCTDGDGASANLGRCLVGTLSLRVVKGIGALRVVHFECVASAVYDAASVTMDDCSFAGVRAVDVPHSVPGPAITQAGVATVSAGVPLSACVAATAVWTFPVPATSGGTCRVTTLNALS